MTISTSVQAYGAVNLNDPASVISEAHRGRINSDPQLQFILTKFRDTFTQSDKYGLPRFGLLSLLAETTPMFIYDHPALLNKVNTAFAIPGAVFISADLFLNILHDDKLSKESQVNSDGALFVIAHEYSHIVRDHFSRCSQYSSDLANIGQDIRINIDNRLDFGLEAGNYLRNVLSGYGLTKEEEDKFNSMPEELICLILFEEAQLQAKQRQQQAQPQNDQPQSSEPQNDQPQNGQSQSGQPQSGQPQSGQPQSGQPQSGQPQSGQPQSGQPQSGKGNIVNSNKIPNLPQYHDLDSMLISSSKDLNHTMNLDEFIDTMMENDLGNVLEKLGIPKDADKAQVDALNNRFKDQILDAYNKAHNIRMTNPNGSKMAGSHIEDAVSYQLSELNKPKLNIKSVIREAILGDGISYKVNEDMPTALYSIPCESMGLEFPLFEAAVEPSEDVSLPTAFIVDTSGSIYNDKQTMTAFFSEALGIVEENDNATVYVFSADTAVRGKPLALSKDTLHECIHNLNVAGGGGTEFTGPINAAFNWIKENAFNETTGQHQECGAIIYMTDLEASAPRLEYLPENLPPILFICRESDYDPKFAKAVEEYATVHTLVGSELDMNALYEENLARREERQLSL